MYRSLQISADGEAYIFDYEGDKKQIWSSVADQGSKWFFYPLPFIVKNEYGMDFQYKRIIEACNGLEFLQGKTIRTAIKWIKENQEYIMGLLS